jgi:hypothetical protein
MLQGMEDKRHARESARGGMDLAMGLDQEALNWFNTLVCGFPCYDPNNWNGHPRAHEFERRLQIGILWKLERVFEMYWGFQPNPFGKVPPKRNQFI